MKKKIVTMFIVGMLAISVVACGKSEKNQESTATTAIESVNESETVSAEPEVTTGELFILDSNDLSKSSEYVDYIVLNEGTEDEDANLIYRIPSGKYIIKNVGTHIGQVEILLADEMKVNEDGWEETVSGEYGEIFLLDTEEEKEIEIHDGYAIHIVHPDAFDLIEIK